jgi:hypothetical protein
MKINYLALAFSLFFLFVYCQNKPVPSVAKDTLPPVPSGKTGKELAEIYCGSCHLYPEPSLLDTGSWLRELLPNMGARLGIRTEGYNPLRKLNPEDAMMIGVENIYPEKPLIAVEDWVKIVAFYRETAPSVLPPAKTQLVTNGLKNFKIHLPTLPKMPSMVTLTQIDTVNGRLLIGGLNRRLWAFSPQLQVLDSFDLPSPPVALTQNQLTFNVLGIGNIHPNEMMDGSFFQTDKNSKQSQTLFQTLRRPVHFVETDLTGDGQNDLVVCEYGYQKGQLTWFERKGEGWKPHVLAATSGASKVFAHDFDKDGRTDLAVLFAQGDERSSLFYNRGKGKFEEKTVLRFPPVYGSADARWMDFNGDGALDIVYTCGDNEDFSPVLKPYHGIRVYLNDGKDNFTEGVFYPMNGAFQAAAADFDGDGDMDIAAAAFFPKDKKQAAANFMLLEQTQPMIFKPATFPEANRGKWMTMDIGDADRDGDVDILLGSFSIQMAKGGQRNEASLPFLFLENLLKK